MKVINPEINIDVLHLPWTFPISRKKNTVAASMAMLPIKKVNPT
jgi:hypothetical protein